MSSLVICVYADNRYGLAYDQLATAMGLQDLLDTAALMAARPSSAIAKALVTKPPAGNPKSLCCLLCLYSTAHTVI